jgi:hypothetical protein
VSQAVLLGIVAIAILVIAPMIGASTIVKVDPNQTSSPLLARTIFDAEFEDIEGEDISDRRQENLENGNVEERRNDAENWADENEE